MPLNRFANRIITEADEALAIKHTQAGFLVSDYLSDGTDDELGGADYSSSNNTGRYTATSPTVITSMAIFATDSDVAQDTVAGGAAFSDTVDPEGFLIANTALTNGFNFKVFNGSGTSQVDILGGLAGIKSLYELQGLCVYSKTEVALESATTGSNMIAFTGIISFPVLFGKGILLRKDDYLACVVRDQTTGLSLKVQVFGYKI